MSKEAFSPSRPFTAKLAVDKNIVDLLSRSTYQKSLTNALREMVSNAYDADATRIDVTINEAKSTIIIRDNGNGMTDEDFSYYLRIAGRRRGKRETPVFKRKRIGQFGVGFLSIFPFCKTIKISTTTAGSAAILTAQIPTARYFEKPLDSIDVDTFTIEGLIINDPKQLTEHYTELTLIGLTEAATQAINKNSVYEVGATKGRRKVADVEDWPPYLRLKWELQEELPLRFEEGSDLNNIFKIPDSEVIKVYLDDQELFRNSIKGSILESNTVEINEITFTYAIITPWKTVSPVNLRNIKVRLNNVGVGRRTEFDIQRSRQYQNIAWLSGEVNIASGLDTSISVSRDSFLESEVLASLNSKLAAILRKQAFEVERIHSSDRIMGKQLRGSKQVKVEAKSSVVTHNVQKLKEKGFEVVRLLSRDAPKATSSPVNVDKDKKIVTVITDHPDLVDAITVDGTRYKLLYEHFPTTALGKVLPCELDQAGNLKINLSFPYYNSARYGEMFKRIFMLIEIAQKRSKDKAGFRQYILDNFDQLFAQYK